MALTIRNAEPADYSRAIAVVDAWWGGRRMADMLPSPVNESSVSFHRSLGFELEPGGQGYDGPGQDRVLLVKRL